MLLCPSIMCADLNNLKNEINKIDNLIDIYHLDIMDNNFVKNTALSIKQIKNVCELTNKKIDCHLMVKNPIYYIKKLLNTKINIFYIYLESLKKNNDIEKIIKLIYPNKKIGLVIENNINVDFIKKYNQYIDYYLIMAVKSGFVGQKFKENTFDKINIIKLLKKNNAKIIVDGGVTLEKYEQLLNNVDGVVLGTSLLFNKNNDYVKCINNLKEKENV